MDVAQPPLQFAVFRIVLGLYLLVWFATLAPYADELLSRAGMVPDPAANLVHAPFPSLLVWADSPAAARAFGGAMALVAAALAAGWLRRAAAVILWYALACAAHRNELLADPSTPFVGWLLLACALVPLGEPLTVGNRSRLPAPGFAVPPRLVGAAWVVLGVSYTVAGAVKLRSPAWRHGDAFALFLANPLHRDAIAWAALHALPAPALAAVTWLALGAETLAGPLALSGRTRPIAWGAIAGMHLVILATMRTTMLTLGALLPLVFTFDARWLARLPGAGARPRATPPPPTPTRARAGARG